MKRFAMMVFAVLAIAIAAMAQSAIHVCRTDGSIITVADSTIRGMEWVNVDSQGVAHANYVMLVIRTDTDTLRLPLTAIDSISFKPMIGTIAVTTVTAPSVAYNGATLAGSVTGVYDQNVTAIGMIYGTMAELSATVGTKAASGSTANGGYTVAVGGLSSGTEYYYRAYVEVDSTAYLYGEVKSFTTAEYESVDLGLSVKWAACNVGTTSPEGYGSLYAWGETSAKDYEFNQDNYKYYSSGGYTDIGSDISGTDCDAARANWGGHWRMPTSAEMQELCDSCTWTWTTQNEINGMKVTGKNGNSIFLPAAGSIKGILMGAKGMIGEYWSGTLSASSDAAIDLLLRKDGSHSWNNNTARYAGLSIRPIFEIITASTDSVTAIYPTGATLAGSVASNSKSTLSMGMIYGTASTLSAASGTKVAGDSTVNGSYTVDLRTLSASTTYYYRAYALRGNEYIYGEVKSFTTPAYDAVGDAIDLGLSVKWASCNVGATEPEEYGGLYSWGETMEKTDYSLAAYKYYNGSYTDIGSNISGTEYDVARARWGTFWRMPTKAEYQELIDSCTWAWTTQNGVNGMKVTGKNGNSIFLPAAGEVYTNNAKAHRNTDIDLWTSNILSTDSMCANSVHYASGVYDMIFYKLRYIGLSVRPVADVDFDEDSVEIRATRTVIKGALLNVNNANGLTMGVIYGTSADLKAACRTVGDLNLSYGIYFYSVNLRELKPSTTYYYRCYVVMGNGYYYDVVRSFTTKAEPIGEAIDLGLSVKWASCNVSASAPEDYGGYYAWGETEEKDEYSQSNYKYFADGSYVDIGNEISGTEYDVARAKWGGNWRLPTKAEQQELIDSCTWTWTAQNGVNGYKVAGKNGNSIFLPAAGNRNGTAVNYVGGDGYYWSGTLGEFSANHAYHLLLDDSGANGVYYNYRHSGFSVRPVVK
jgi:hypothetical protein